MVIQPLALNQRSSINILDSGTVDGALGEMYHGTAGPVTHERKEKKIKKKTHEASKMDYRE